MPPLRRSWGRSARIPGNADQARQVEQRRTLATRRARVSQCPFFEREGEVDELSLDGRDESNQGCQ
jgi:hypothetical protein